MSKQIDLEIKLEQLKLKVHTLERELAEAKSYASWMQTSKFWKLREIYMYSKVVWHKLKEKLTNFTQLNETISFPPLEINLQVDQQGETVKLVNPLQLKNIPSILLVVEDSLPQCFRYRVAQKLEQLRILDYPVKWLSWKEDPKIIKYHMHFCHIVILYRVPAFDPVIEYIQYAKSMNRVIIFDIDDLIFDKKYYPPPYKDLQQQVSIEDYKALEKGCLLYHTCLSLSDYAMASTLPLSQLMEQSTIRKRSYVHRNSLDEKVVAHSQSSYVYKKNKFQKEKLYILYGSGTKTHDADFELVSVPIGRIMEEFDNLDLLVIGYLNLPKSLNKFSERIHTAPFLEEVVYWDFISGSDINIAPLHTSIFNDCKSEIKWLEAAIFEVPSIVTPTENYRDVLTHGKNVLFSSSEQEWYDNIKNLILEHDLRVSIGKSAKTTALEVYRPNSASQTLSDILTDIVSREVNLIRISKPCILFVNVLYPPQALGGATTSLYNIISFLKKKYGEKYQFKVFTSHINTGNSYAIDEYEYDEVHVTRLRIPTFPVQEWRYKDDQVYQIFNDFIQFVQPDLIHFHCLQRLTASLLEASNDNGIPYVVTVHDTWWISDSQFFLNNNDQFNNYDQANPIFRLHQVSDVNASVIRRQYLFKQLNKSKIVFAVSEFQAQLYKRSGIKNVVMNKNGILPFDILNQNTTTGIIDSQKVIIGYAGGIATHKGFFLLQEIFKKHKFSEIILKVIDISHSSPVLRDTWGTTSVEFLAPFENNKMNQFYAQVDIVIVPSQCLESFGLIVREALYSGVWVIVSNNGALAEDVIENVNGNIIHDNSINGWTKILTKINSYPSEYKQKQVQQTNVRTIEAQVIELEDFYESLLIARENS